MDKTIRPHTMTNTMRQATTFAKAQRLLLLTVFGLLLTACGGGGGSAGGTTQPPTNKNCVLGSSSIGSCKL